LTLDLLIPKSEAFILAQSLLVVKVWSKFINKYLDIVLTMFVRKARTHVQPLWKNNATGHYIGGSKKALSSKTGNNKLLLSTMPIMEPQKFSKGFISFAPSQCLQLRGY